MLKKFQTICAMLLYLCCVAQAQVTIGSAVQQTLPIHSGAGSAASILSVSQAKTSLSSGQRIDGSLIVLFDPASRLFWWMHQSSTQPADPARVLRNSLDSYTFFESPTEITCFIVQGRSLWVRASNVQVSSLDEGIRKAESLLPAELSKFISGETMWFHQVPLAEAVGPTFFHPKDIGDPPVQLKIKSIEQDASGWRIEIENDKGERKVVRVSENLKTVRSE